eukprot:gnl/MRDRNA2_/MRDRNA2_74191_c0_seq1.p1 gnl/MRDRNA2_/MRDRNA2_74191_c0~~gnl/MRDRNA2_/MRDRNA2_74191_c0_seq1.p1  ORF type:complete len:1441 (+),score=225.46 gnl/MRDRNA2_/MRDRNA2_74191_c0_seq1:74-4396(+)
MSVEANTDFLSLITQCTGATKIDEVASGYSMQETRFEGDADALSDAQQANVRKLKECMTYPRAKLKKVAQSFSGSIVLFWTPITRDGTLMPSSILKIDTAANVEDELQKTINYAPFFGAAVPQVQQAVIEQQESASQVTSILQLELCGGSLGLPEFTKAPPVVTFASQLSHLFESDEDKSIETEKTVNQAFQKVLCFMKHERAVGSVELLPAYKIQRFFCHGITERAKEASKRAQKSMHLAVGFLQPADAQELDMDGSYVENLFGSKLTVQDCALQLTAQLNACAKHFHRSVVRGLVHGDLHGGNLLVDSQSTVWIIDFATVKQNHSLFDCTKFLASVCFMYCDAQVNQDDFNQVLKVLCSTPDATTPLPPKKSPVAANMHLQLLLESVRYYCCHFEGGEDAPDNDGIPFIISFLSWSVRMMSYEEPNFLQKKRALGATILFSCRLLYAASKSMSEVFVETMVSGTSLWESSKGARLSVTALSNNDELEKQAQMDVSSFLGQLGAVEGWMVDIVTRERLDVRVQATNLQLSFTYLTDARNVQIYASVEQTREFFQVLRESNLKESCRFLVAGDGGTGKTTLTKQLLCATAQQQYERVSSMSWKDEVTFTMPLRVPLMDFMQFIGDEDPLSQWARGSFGDQATCVKALTYARASADSAVFCLWDAVDETSASKIAVVEAICQIMQERSMCFACVTSRPSALVLKIIQLLGSMGATSYNVVPLSDALVVNITDLTYTRISDDSQALTKVKEKILLPVFTSLRRVPVILNLLIHVLSKVLVQSNMDASLQRHQIMRKAMGMMIQVEKVKSYGKSDLQNAVAETKDTWLLCQQVAWVNHTKQARNFSWEEMSAIIGSTVSGEDKASCGCLLDVTSNAEVQTFMFSHLSFQEALVAQGLSCVLMQHASLNFSLQELVNKSFSSKAGGDRDYVGSSWWISAQMMVLEEIEDKEALLNCILQDERACLRVGGLTHAWNRDIPSEFIMHIVLTMCQDDAYKSCDLKPVKKCSRVKVNCIHCLLRDDNVGSLFRKVAEDMNLNKCFHHLVCSKVNIGCCDDTWGTFFVGMLNAFNASLMNFICGKSIIMFDARTICQNNESFYANWTKAHMFADTQLCNQQSLARASKATHRQELDAVASDEKNGKALGVTSFMIHAAEGDLVKLQILIDTKGEVNQTSVSGATAINSATITNCLNVCSLLLEHRASVEHTCENPHPSEWRDGCFRKLACIYNVPSVYLCMQGSCALLNMFFENKADPMAYNKSPVALPFLMIAQTSLHCLGADGIYQLITAKADPTRSSCQAGLLIHVCKGDHVTTYMGLTGLRPDILRTEVATAIMDAKASATLHAKSKSPVFSMAPLRNTFTKCIETTQVFAEHIADWTVVRDQWPLHVNALHCDAMFDAYANVKLHIRYRLNLWSKSAIGNAIKMSRNWASQRTAAAFQECLDAE